MAIVVDHVAAPRAHLSVGAIVRVGLAVLWAVWAALAWWTAPRTASGEQLESDLAAGRITTYTMADSWHNSRLWAAPARAQGSDDGTMVVWTTANGQTFYTTPSSQANDVKHRLAFAGALHRSGPSDLAQWASNLALVLVAAGLCLLWTKPDPARGTRWFWFWVGQSPLGLGYLAWLWWERPGTPTAPQASRHSGWLGLGLMFLAGIAWILFATTAGPILGSWLIPAL